MFSICIQLSPVHIFLDVILEKEAVYDSLCRIIDRGFLCGA